MTTILVGSSIMISDTKGMMYSTRSVPTVCELKKHHKSECNRFAYGVTGAALDTATRVVLEEAIATYLNTQYTAGFADDYTHLSLVSAARSVLTRFCKTHTVDILFATVDRVYRCSADEVLQISTGTHVAIGSGRGYVTAALRCGLTVQAAMEFAGSMDDVTGNRDFTVTYLDRLTPFGED